jgi:hypothetical protein
MSPYPNYPMMDADDFDEMLSYFRALGEIVVFYEPINPRGENFQQCLDSSQLLRTHLGSNDYGYNQHFCV